MPIGILFPTVPGCVKGFHSHPPCVGRPVGHRDRAGNAIAKGMAEGGTLASCQDGLCDTHNPTRLDHRLHGGWLTVMGATPNSAPMPTG
jgi:hypothetical protein